MRTWAALGLFLLVSCSQGCSGSAVATTSPAGSHVSSSTPRPTATPNSGPSVQPSSSPGSINEAYQPVPGCQPQATYSGRAYGILATSTPATDGTYSVAIVDVAGSVVARASYHGRQFINGITAPVPDGVPLFKSAPLSTSNSRLYYLDGDSDVHMLAPDGTTGLVTRLPGNGHIRTAFAVSPDDRRIAVSVLDYSKSPPSLRLYVEDLGSGANHVEIFSSTSLFVWPIGWHSCRLVVGLGERDVESRGSSPFNPYGASSYHLVDAATGSRLAVIGDPSCPPTGPLGPAGTVCSVGGSTASVLDWNGQASLAGLPSGGGGVWGAAVDPAGVDVAICCSMAGEVLVVGGALTYHDNLWGWPMWMDEDHLLVGNSSQSQPHPVVWDTSGKVTVVDASGYVFARIPGSL